MQTRGPLAMISLQDKVKGLVEKVKTRRAAGSVERGNALSFPCLPSAAVSCHSLQCDQSPEFLSLSQMEKVTLLQSLCTNPAMSQLEKAQKVARERITHLYNRLHQQQSHSLQVPWKTAPTSPQPVPVLPSLHPHCPCGNSGPGSAAGLQVLF